MEAAKKRGPGRPPKSKTKKRLPRNGFADPTNANYVFEFVYDMPMTMRKIFRLFKNYNAETIDMKCDRTGMYFAAKNHLNTTGILVHFVPEQINHYYVENEINIAFETSTLASIIDGINSDFSQIILFISKKAKFELVINFIDTDVEISQYTIYTKPTTQIVDGLRAINAVRDYPVHFSLNAKMFKRKIAEFAHHSNKLTIEQTCSAQQKKIKFSFRETDVSNTSLINNKKLELQSSYDDVLFIVPVFIAQIKPFSTSLISDKIRLHCDEKRDLLITAELDGDPVRCIVHINTALAS